MLKGHTVNFHSVILLQLHLFKCTKEDEIKSTLKKHIYFVNIETFNSNHKLSFPVS